MSDDRVSYWSERITNAGGGLLGVQIGRLADEISPGAGSPLPRIDASDDHAGWLISIDGPKGPIRGVGHDVVSAVGDALARLEEQVRPA